MVRRSSRLGSKPLGAKPLGSTPLGARSLAAVVAVAAMCLTGCASETAGVAQLAETPSAATSVASEAPAVEHDETSAPATPTESVNETTGDPGVASGSDAAAADSDESAASTADASVTSSASTSASADTSSPPSGGADCLVGEWMIPEADMQRYYDSIDTPANFTITGTTGLRFDADTYTYTPDFTLAIDIQGMKATGAITGTVSGSYVSDGEVVTTSNEKNDVAVSIEVGGQKIDGADMFGDFMDMAPINSAPYRCTAEGPLFMFDNGGSERTPVQFTVPR